MTKKYKKGRINNSLSDDCYTQLEVGCDAPNCDVWSIVKVKSKDQAIYHLRSFMCGFCSADIRRATRSEQNKPTDDNDNNQCTNSCTDTTKQADQLEISPHVQSKTQHDNSLSVASTPTRVWKRGHERSYTITKIVSDDDSHIISSTLENYLPPKSVVNATSSNIEVEPQCRMGDSVLRTSLNSKHALINVAPCDKPIIDNNDTSVQANSSSSLCTSSDNRSPTHIASNFSPTENSEVRHAKSVEITRHHYDRSYSVLFSELTESNSANSQEHMDHDVSILRKVLSHLLHEGDEELASSIHVKKLFRLGKRTQEKPRLLKVILSSSDHVRMLLSRGYRLRGLPFRILRDLSPDERLQLRKANIELRHRLSQGEANICIRDFRVVKWRPVVRWKQLAPLTVGTPVSM